MTMRTTGRPVWSLRMVGVLLGALAALLFVAPLGASASTSTAGDVGVHAPAVGTTVCISSRTGGYRCGTVTAVNQTVCFPQGCLYGLVRTNIIPQPGDNGAPVYNQRGQVIGTVVGGGGGSTFYDPL